MLAILWVFEILSDIKQLAAFLPQVLKQCVAMHYHNIPPTKSLVPRCSADILVGRDTKSKALNLYRITSCIVRLLQFLQSCAGLNGLKLHDGGRYGRCLLSLLAFTTRGLVHLNLGGCFRKFRSAFKKRVQVRLATSVGRSDLPPQP